MVVQGSVISVLIFQFQLEFFFHLSVSFKLQLFFQFLLQLFILQLKLQLFY